MRRLPCWLVLKDFFAFWVVLKSLYLGFASLSQNLSLSCLFWQKGACWIWSVLGTFYSFFEFSFCLRNFPTGWTILLLEKTVTQQEVCWISIVPLFCFLKYMELMKQDFPCVCQVFIALACSQSPTNFHHDSINLFMYQAVKPGIWQRQFPLQHIFMTLQAAYICAMSPGIFNVDAYLSMK